MIQCHRKYLVILLIFLASSTEGRPRPHRLRSDHKGHQEGVARKVPSQRMVLQMRRSLEKHLRSTSSNESISDIVNFVDFHTGSSESDIFDLRRTGTLECFLCVWIQPNFAKHFGLSSSIATGVAETLEIIQMLEWIVRSLDLNFDTISDHLTLSMDYILVEDIDSAVSKNLIRFRRSGSSDDTMPFSDTVGSITPEKSWVQQVQKELSEKFQPRKCCGILGFVYHDIPKLLSFSNMRGICSSSNLGIISGRNNLKVGRYDVFRAAFHALAHLFGADHDDKNCMDLKEYDFDNPFIMEPDHYVDVGIRPNSLRLSDCSKSQMATFLSSNLASCLTSVKDDLKPFCGDGIVEGNEECDCGAPWQCVLLPGQCCGIRDSFYPCSIIVKSKDRKCARPSEF